MSFDHAIVLGGSIAGLLSAAALAGEFERVTIVDRDELLVDGPKAKEARRGVPQGDQVHHLLALGAARLNELLPGLDDDFVAAGCEKHDNLAEFASWIRGTWRTRFESELQLTCFTRPVFEWVVRSRVLALPNVGTLKGVTTGLIPSEDGASVIGASVKSAPEGRLLGDLVVDATGRGTKSPNWLEDLGYARPEVAQMLVYQGYTCFRIKVPEGLLPEGVSSLTCAAPTPEGIGLVLWPCGNGEHIVASGSVMRNYPPSDFEGILKLADELEAPQLAEILRKSKLLSQPASYKMAGDQRILWENLERRPEGFVAIGDAVGSYNPMYGQGMTMAAVGAVELRTQVEKAHGEVSGLATAFQTSLAAHVDIAWTNAITIDSQYEGVEYENVTPPPPSSKEFAFAFVELQSEDPATALAARRAVHWMDNSHIDASVQSKVADWISSGRRPRPEVSDPTIIPEKVLL